MMSSGINSASSAYLAAASFTYNSTSISPLKADMESSSAGKSTGNSFPGEINDEAIISDAAKALLAKEESQTQAELSDKKDKSQPEESKKAQSDAVQTKEELTPEQEQVVAELKARDTEVRAHEAAHIAAAAGIGASSATFSYQKGPDGNKYAIGGEVSLSFSKGSNPADTIAKAQTMKAAALAPAQPSGQDMSVARAAEKMIQEARLEMAEKQTQSKQSPQADASEPLFKDSKDKSEPLFKDSKDKTDGLSEKKTSEPLPKLSASSADETKSSASSLNY